MISIEDLKGWVQNDEALYNWCLREEGGYTIKQITRFIKRNRTALTQYVEERNKSRSYAPYLAGIPASTYQFISVR